MGHGRLRADAIMDDGLNRKVICTLSPPSPLTPPSLAVTSDDVFQLHISELIALLQKEDAGCDEKHDVDLVEEALMRRKAAVAALLAKP